jgi:hypothetical protein
MARIYKLTDRVPYKVGEVEIEISPLNIHDKALLHSMATKSVENADNNQVVATSAFAIKSAVKSVKGLENGDGSAYQLEFEQNGSYLTDECVTDLLNIQESAQMIALCVQLIAGIPRTLPGGISLVEDKHSPLEVTGKKRRSK